jgi:hypothetical protein
VQQLPQIVRHVSRSCTVVIPRRGGGGGDSNHWRDTSVGHFQFSRTGKGGTDLGPFGKPAVPTCVVEFNVEMLTQPCQTDSVFSNYDTLPLTSASMALFISFTDFTK